MIENANKIQRTHIRAAIMLVIMVTIGIIIYSNSLHAIFTFDDRAFIIDDQAIHITDLSLESLRTAAMDGFPAHRYLPNLSFAINYYFGQLNTFGYHLVNLAIHLLTGTLLFFFIRLTLRVYVKNPDDPNSDMIAFFAALIWIVQPVGTQSVTYICQRMASMVAMFYLASLVLYVKARLSMRHNPAGRLKPFLLFTGCAIAAVCALATKENAGTLPIIILLYEWFFFQDLQLRWSRNQMLWGLFFILVFGGAVVWYMGENPLIRLLGGYRNRDFSMLERVLTEFRIVVYYISLFLWAPPGRLNLDHDYPLSLSPVHPPTTLVSFAAIIGLFALAISIARKDRLTAFCILWFFITQATESTIVGIELIFEHRTYIPFMMLSFLFAMLAFRLFQNKKTAYALLCALTLVFSAWTFQRNFTWQNPVTFWKDCVQKSPEKLRPTFNLGLALYDKGDVEGAFIQYQKAIKINPRHLGVLINLGNVLVQKDMTESAIYYYDQALAINPQQGDVHLSLGKIYAQKKAFDQAFDHFEQALKTNPKSAVAYNNLGIALSEKGLNDQAIDAFNQALAIDPEYTEVHNNLGNALFRKGQLDEALYHYETVITKDPKAANTLKNRDALLSLLKPTDQVKLLFKTAVRFSGEKKYDLAVSLFQRILTITPDNELIYYNISCIYALRDQKKQAVNWLKQAVDHGYKNWDKLKTDPDLDNIKDEPYYQDLVK